MTKTKFIVKCNFAPYPTYLRGTVFTSEISRAQLFMSVDEARAAIEKAAKFHKRNVMRTLSIILHV